MRVETATPTSQRRRRDDGIVLVPDHRGPDPHKAREFFSALARHMEAGRREFEREATP